ncbi:MaoC family dehydratase [Betaproteobacteria bacterium]|nr:MaoC family dehydratase [Betaproteobacteria bacterium]
MSDFYLKVGDSVTFSKTVSESDVYLFAGITGDFAPNHVDEEFMKHTKYGKRIAHGALMIGYMSTASSKIIEKSEHGNSGKETPVSLGYDRIRFLEAVCIGDTITVTYKVKEIDVMKRRSVSSIVITNQNGKEVTIATHILKWVAAA